MSSRDSRFTATKGSARKTRVLPVLNGDVSIYANPVDTYC